MNDYTPQEKKRLRALPSSGQKFQVLVQPNDQVFEVQLLEPWYMSSHTRRFWAAVEIVSGPFTGHVLDIPEDHLTREAL
jgi:hypothetical protein